MGDGTLTGCSCSGAGESKAGNEDRDIDVALD